MTHNVDCIGHGMVTVCVQQKQLNTSTVSLSLSLFIGQTEGSANHHSLLPISSLPFCSLPLVVFPLAVIHSIPRSRKLLFLDLDFATLKIVPSMMHHIRDCFMMQTQAERLYKLVTRLFFKDTGQDHDEPSCW